MTAHRPLQALVSRLAPVHSRRSYNNRFRNREKQPERHPPHDRPLARLLLTDDESALHTILADELSRLGYAIELTFSGETGNRRLTKCIPILVLTSKEITPR